MNDMKEPARPISDVLTRMTEEIAHLAGLVHEKLVSDDDTAICEAGYLDELPQKIAWEITGDGSPEYAAKLGQTVEVFLSAAEMLMNSPIKSADTIVPSSERENTSRAEDHGPFWEWVQPRLAGCCVPESAPEAERIRIELLTACWLGLYFLGVPFGGPWAFVLRWAEDEGGGLPNGVCVAKAIGDIARDARKLSLRRKSFENAKAQPRDSSAGEAGDDVEGARDVPETHEDEQSRLFARARQEKMAEPMLIVLSGWPLLLFRNLLAGPEIAGCTPEGAHVLGRCYEFVQLALYLRTGEELVYCIREDSVMQIFDFLDNDPEKPLTRDEAFKRWKGGLEGLYGICFDPQDPSHLEKQRMYIVGDRSVPPCFINHERGLYTFGMLEPSISARAGDVRNREMPLPASYMRNIRRRLYIDSLTDDQKIGECNLLQRSADHHEAEFDKLWNLYRRASGS